MFSRVACLGRPSWAILCLLSSSAVLGSVLQNGDDRPLAEKELIFGPENQNVLQIIPVDPKPPSSNPAYPKPLGMSPAAVTSALQDLHSALSVMQSTYFSLWLGKWTTAIDWTAAVLGTHLSSTLSSLSHSLSYTLPGTFDKTVKLDVEAQMVENEINKYFAQSIAYFFGEDAFAIRMEAYDDMLWVVLGWLESMNFINSHSERHYPLTEGIIREESEWHGKQFIPAFAHRARVFYELAEQGWDWELCSGGMLWSPHTLPYKNAITNQLFISAAVSMYLYFPGDDNCSPFMSDQESGVRANFKMGKQDMDECDERMKGKSTYDPIYLASAINGYKWLKNSGMMNEKGLYVDGFHIHDYGKNGTIGTGKCDERNEMVYTYNQGVILSGLRGLWEATGNLTYLEDGHELIRNVIRATGWTDTDTPTIFLTESQHQHDTTKRPSVSNHQAHDQTWSGLGSSGILTELCDPYGTCSQNGQTFKGIFFHHLTNFCTPLPTSATTPGKTFAASKDTATLHQRSCNEYAPWVIHNARSALRTRDEKGRFGMWWGTGLASHGHDFESDTPPAGRLPNRNDPLRPSLPEDATDHQNPVPSSISRCGRFPSDREGQEQPCTTGDLNDRGRGRTVETQGGGVAVVRAMWEFLRHFNKG